MNLKWILMTLGNNLVARRHFDPSRVSLSSEEKSTDPIRQFTEWLNGTPEAVKELKELGIAWPMKPGDEPLRISSPLSEEQIAPLIDELGRLTVVVKMPLGQIACASTDETYDGFNNIVSEYVGVALTDIKYHPVGTEGENVWIEVNGEVNTETNWPLFQKH